MLFVVSDWQQVGARKQSTLPLQLRPKEVMQQMHTAAVAMQRATISVVAQYRHRYTAWSQLACLRFESRRTANVSRNLTEVYAVRCRKIKRSEPQSSNRLITFLYSLLLAELCAPACLMQTAHGISLVFGTFGLRLCSLCFVLALLRRWWMSAGI